MDVRKFAKEIVATLPQIHLEFVRRQPNIIMKGKLTFPQMIILEILRAQNECKMGDLSRMLGVTKSAVTGLTDRLIKVGLARRRRSKEDRRVVKIKLTPKGSSLSKQINEYKLRMIASLFSNISPKERTVYLGILRKLEKNIRVKNKT